jgi:sugar phosphate permease
MSGGAAATGRYRWTILAVGVIAQGALAALQQGLPALGPVLREELSLSLAEVGVVLTSVAWGVMLTLLAWGWLADRIGERIVISAGLGGGALALVLASSADGYGELVASLALAGALTASASAASGRAVIGWFGRSERGLALGIRQMSVPLGGAVAALALPVLAAAGGLRAALLGLAVAAALAAVIAALWIREPPPPPPNRPVVDSPPPLRDRRVWRLALGSALLVCAQVAITSFVVLFLHDHRGVAAGTAAGALAAIQVGGALSRLVVGRRSDLSGRRVAPLLSLALATAVAVGATAALADAPLALLIPVLLAAGVLAMSWNGLSFTATAEISGRARAGTAIGLQQTVMRGLSAAAGVGFGVLVAATSWPAGFALLTVFPLAGWWVLRPLADEEEDRILARERRLAAAA